MEDRFQAPAPLTRQQKRARARHDRKSGILLVAGALAVGIAGIPAEAATFTVANLNDSGAGSLRQAVLDANGAAGADVIAFQAGLTGTITLTTGELGVSDSVDIQGPGSAVLTVSGNDASRLFYLDDDEDVLDVTISGLTLTDGNAGNGAGIFNNGERLIVDRVTLQGNHSGGDGGAIHSAGSDSQLTVTASTISGNTAESGAGIYVGLAGLPTLLQDTRITGNDAEEDGGGIYLFNPQEIVTIERCTIADNSAIGTGGGLALIDPDGGTFILRESTLSGNDAASSAGALLDAPYTNMALENDTISGNQATAGSGGGLSLTNQKAAIAIRHSTIAGNSATSSGGGITLAGGRAALENSIVADNAAPADPDLSGAGTFDLAFSLVENPGAATTGDNGGNLLNQDPQLGPLADNGGPTQTQQPAGTSPALDAGDPSFAPPPTTDQRGFPRVAGGRLDMGAVERTVGAAGTIQFALTTASVGENAGTVTITATRTGGSDGAVSASYATFDGTAVSPADFLAAMGTFNWADGDTAPKSIQVTIVDDLLVEGSEVFTVQLSAPTGGATLGSATTEAVTILDNDGTAPNPAEVPTLGEMGRLLFAGLLGGAGLLALRRRRAQAS